jgi:hypothetical protein
MLFLFGGFMLFNFMTNIGRNAQRYLIAGAVFLTRFRRKGAGFAASFAKIGAVTPRLARMNDASDDVTRQVEEQKMVLRIVAVSTPDL